MVIWLPLSKEVQKNLQDLSSDETMIIYQGFHILLQATSTVWVFLLTNLCLEILSAIFDQIASPSKPDYALFGMVLAISAVLTCIVELIHKGKKEGVELKRWGKLWWFYYPPPNGSLFGTFPDICGLVIAISQYICSTLQYVYLCRHVNNPIKLSVLPAIFLICLAGSTLIRNRSYTTDETFKQTTHRLTKTNYLCRFWHSVQYVLVCTWYHSLDLHRLIYAHTNHFRLSFQIVVGETKQLRRSIQVSMYLM